MASVPLVAIATPVYNGARFLDETMACVQAQTYPRLVHCVLDNASTDATPQIIEKYRNGPVPLIVARNAETLLQLENWNAALAMVPQGASYFRILPADDLMVPDCIGKMVALGEQYPQASVIGCRGWNNDALFGGDMPTDRSLFSGRAIARHKLRKEIHGPPYQHCLYRKPRGPMTRHFYDIEHYGTPLLDVDLDAAIRALSRGDYACVHEPLVVSRMHDGSITSTYKEGNFVDFWSILQIIDRWGPTVFETRAEYLACRRRHLRYYYRWLLYWRVTGRHEMRARHLAWLRKASALPTAGAYLHAVLEWPFLRAAWQARRTAVRLGLKSPVFPIIEPAGVPA
ncbi:glycosyltransferase family 2 protein [Ancylobacter mangrovi]|uniref:glycosyltransferase family 2 protein n=1 Tax=Ancylobacter mangrovi TaxID=2972472 RepID=UPI0021624427|nr:glycosyltransferase family 2 protein [Ancylobacter mangrovi]MCS0501273.1 glycosyltransferase family 2 protein [Ancylobacter mangrovi]